MKIIRVLTDKMKETEQCDQSNPGKIARHKYMRRRKGAARKSNASKRIEIRSNEKQVEREINSIRSVGKSLIEEVQRVEVTYFFFGFHLSTP